MEKISAAPSGWDLASRSPSVARIMYASQANVQGSIYAEMERIRSSAVRHNEPAGVATALLYQSGWFAQWKEGPREAVYRIMERVAPDPRHYALRIIHSSEGPRLLAGPWSMAIVQCDDAPADMAQRVEQLCADLALGRQYSPPAVWRRISTPLRHHATARQTGPDGFQRVMVCAATGMSSFALVQWLARAHHEELVHRRYAGARDLDVGTDYVDFVHAERVLRLVAMARHGLTLPLTRAFLPDYSHVVLLLSGDRERDGALLERVGQGCAGQVSPPALLGVAHDPTVHREMFSLARQRGLIYLDVQANIHDFQACWGAMGPQLAAWQDASNNSSWPVVPLRFG